MNQKNALLKEAHDLLHTLLEGGFVNPRLTNLIAIGQLHRRIARNLGLVELD